MCALLVAANMHAIAYRHYGCYTSSSTLMRFVSTRDVARLTHGVRYYVVFIACMVVPPTYSDKDSPTARYAWQRALDMRDAGAIIAVDLFGSGRSQGGRPPYPGETPPSFAPQAEKFLGFYHGFIVKP